MLIICNDTTNAAIVEGDKIAYDSSVKSYSNMEDFIKELG